MATNFVDAVKEHTKKLAKLQEPKTEDIVPVIVGIVKQNNLQLVRTLRSNPSLLGTRK